MRQFRRDDRSLDETIREGFTRTFDQDKAILEAQQRSIGPDPDNVSFPVSTRVDAGPIQGRKLVQTMLAREASPPRRRTERATAAS